MRDYKWGLEEESGEIVRKIASPVENSSADEHNLVEFSGNNIFFYSTVSRPKILKLNKSWFFQQNCEVVSASDWNSFVF